MEKLEKNSKCLESEHRQVPRSRKLTMATTFSTTSLMSNFTAVKIEIHFFCRKKYLMTV